MTLHGATPDGVYFRRRLACHPPTYALCPSANGRQRLAGCFASDGRCIRGPSQSLCVHNAPPRGLINAPMPRTEAKMPAQNA